MDDPADYASLARSMADGNGYSVTANTSHEPHVERLPLWPILMVPGMWLFPKAGDPVVMRCTTVLIHGATAILIALFSYYLWADVLGALLAGIAFGVYPMALAFTMEGGSEPAFVATSVGGSLLLVSARRGWAQILGALLSGLAVLARGYYVILPLTVAVAALLIDRRVLLGWRRLIIFCAVFLVFPVGWVLRNYAVSGSFPLLTATQGETLYGANNARVATDLDYWGYWILPDEIPGEIPKHQLRAHLSEAAVDHYYHQRAVEYFKANWISYPRLLLGKLVRGFIPIPWVPIPLEYVVFLCRLLLYALFLWYAAKGIIKSQIFKIYLIAMLLVLLVTTLIYYGCARFTYMLEVFLILPCTAGIAKDLRTWWERRGRGAKQQREQVQGADPDV